MGWTQDQEKAIYTDTGIGNLLVSAAAGSGKTAVLVERVLQKILSGKSTIDRLLVVTFTEAAASEMRQKIVKRLYEYIKENDCTDDEIRLIKSQIRLTQTADIMTIDGFCNRVVVNNFHTLGIDPNIGICDDAMASLLIGEAFRDMFDEIYKSTDDEVKARFSRLSDFYAKDRSNDKLKDLVMSVYRFTEAFADPKKWLDDAVASYSLPILEQPAVKYRFDYSKNTAHRVICELDLADDSAAKEFIKGIAEAIYNADSWDEIYNIYKEHFSAPKKRTAFFDKVGDSCDGRTRFAANLLCGAFTPSKLGKTALGITQSEAELIKSHNSELLKSEAEDIVWLVGLFMEKLSKVKEERNLYEFSDIEHFAYRLFADNETIRNEYTNKYDEILIDEYQDTNMLQDTIFRLISHDNIFMVGDLKQSIYRFRKGDPYIFKAKARDYEKPQNEHNRVILSQNFRSRQEVLKSVNSIFEAIMSEDVGDVDYSGGELIVRDDAHEYYPTPSDDKKSELHYLAIHADAELDRETCEARYTAKKIHELLTSGKKVYDKSTKQLRDIRKSDIVILENSVKYNADIITNELGKLGIDSYIDMSEFFDRREITVMLSLLSVINNTHNDIPLLSVMRSPIGGFTDDELAAIRIHAKGTKYFIDAVSAYADSGTDEKLRAQCIRLLSSLRRWRDYIRTRSVAQLIWAIYEETYFYDFMGALERNDEAQTNLRLLYERAKQFEASGFKGLFNFIKYINHLKDTDSDLEGAKLIGENNDIVRIMTIHKSKGLEFPYVFLLGAGRDFPQSQDYSAIRMHKTLGLGLYAIDYENHFARKTYPFELISHINKIEGISERMRLLYVALTRPREKLYVISARKHAKDTTIDDITASWRDIGQTGKLLPEEALTAKGFHSWLCPAAYNSDTWNVFVNVIETTIDTPEGEAEATDGVYKDSAALRESVYKILDYKYPHSQSHLIPTRTSVTQLKERAQADYEYEPQSRKDSGDDFDYYAMPALRQKPSFMQDCDEKPASEIGTLYHLAMSKLDINKVSCGSIDDVQEELQMLVCDGTLSDDDLRYIDTDKIKAFFDSELGIRMSRAKNVYRERQFQINISARDYDASLVDISDSDTVILQGIIDCFFEEADGYVLFDYKTDKVKTTAQDIKEKYKKQLELYKRAIEKLTEKPVKECYLYLFDTNEVI